ncbi:MAG: 5'-nucleotidase, lipoprotein e(P4) family [Prolixibacteraceae bacterium]|jgi:5'-nucleotidase (lipoprotein e(P4) family)|nr:5'-nucleotidase, lipoprotein e(P4) family [Prolixibacteraceae bacterium]
MRALKYLPIAFLCLHNFLSEAQNCGNKSTVKEFELLPVLWQQYAPEYRALCYQAFNTARYRIENILSESSGAAPKAIITDLDETIIDNSYCYGRAFKNNTTPDWQDWKTQTLATALPGAVDFLQNVHQKGIHIFYISNRDTSETENTLENMKILNLPHADKDHLLLRGNTSSKEERRKQVAAQYDIILYIGDNLQDFSSLYEGGTSGEKAEITDQLHQQWGKMFIVLPNPVYGDWLNTLHNHRFGLTPDQRDSAYTTLLKGY